MLSRLVIDFLIRSKHLLISWLLSPSAVILEPPKIKSVTVSIVSPSICHEVMGPDAMILVFWMLSFFFFYMIFYMFQCHSPKSSPVPLPQSPKDCSIHLCLFCRLAYRVIVTIFLNSVYMRLYTVLVFSFWLTSLCIIGQSLPLILSLLLKIILDPFRGQYELSKVDTG